MTSYQELYISKKFSQTGSPSECKIIINNPLDRFNRKVDTIPNTDGDIKQDLENTNRSKKEESQVTDSSYDKVVQNMKRKINYLEKIRLEENSKVGLNIQKRPIVAQNEFQLNEKSQMGQLKEKIQKTLNNGEYCKQENVSESKNKSKKSEDTSNGRINTLDYSYNKMVHHMKRKIDLLDSIRVKNENKLINLNTQETKPQNESRLNNKEKKNLLMNQENITINNQTVVTSKVNTLSQDHNEKLQNTLDLKNNNSNQTDYSSGKNIQENFNQSNTGEKQSRSNLNVLKAELQNQDQSNVKNKENQLQMDESGQTYQEDCLYSEGNNECDYNSTSMIQFCDLQGSINNEIYNIENCNDFTTSSLQNKYEYYDLNPCNIEGELIRPNDQCTEEQCEILHYGEGEGGVLLEKLEERRQELLDLVDEQFNTLEQFEADVKGIVLRVPKDEEDTETQGFIENSAKLLLDLNRKKKDLLNYREEIISHIGNEPISLEDSINYISSLNEKVTLVMRELTDEVVKVGVKVSTFNFVRTSSSNIIMSKLQKRNITPQKRASSSSIIISNLSKRNLLATEKASSSSLSSLSKTNLAARKMR